MVYYSPPWLLRTYYDCRLQVPKYRADRDAYFTRRLGGVFGLAQARAGVGVLAR